MSNPTMIQISNNNDSNDVDSHCNWKQYFQTSKQQHDILPLQSPTHNEVLTEGEIIQQLLVQNDQTSMKKLFKLYQVFQQELQQLHNNFQQQQLILKTKQTSQMEILLDSLQQQEQQQILSFSSTSSLSSSNSSDKNQMKINEIIQAHIQQQHENEMKFQQQIQFAQQKQKEKFHEKIQEEFKQTQNNNNDDSQITLQDYTRLYTSLSNAVNCIDSINIIDNSSFASDSVSLTDCCSSLLDRSFHLSPSLPSIDVSITEDEICQRQQNNQTIFQQFQHSMEIIAECRIGWHFILLLHSNSVYHSLINGDIISASSSSSSSANSAYFSSLLQFTDFHRPSLHDQLSNLSNQLGNINNSSAAFQTSHSHTIIPYHVSHQTITQQSNLNINHHDNNENHLQGNYDLDSDLDSVSDQHSIESILRSSMLRACLNCCVCLHFPLIFSPSILSILPLLSNINSNSSSSHWLLFHRHLEFIMRTIKVIMKELTNITFKKIIFHLPKCENQIVKNQIKQKAIQILQEQGTM